MGLAFLLISTSAFSQITTTTNKLQLIGDNSKVFLEPPAAGGDFTFQIPEAPTSSTFVLTKSNLGQTINNGVQITDSLSLPASTKLLLKGVMGSSSQVVGVDVSGNVSWVTPSSTVTRNATLTGNGTSGSPLGVNLANANTWTANQTFAGTFLIASNSRIALTNSDNNARDVRFQEPSGTGTQYVGFRAPSVANIGNYRLPAVIPPVGALMTVDYSNNVDSAYMNWTTPNNSLSSNGSSIGINLSNTNTWAAQQNFDATIRVGASGATITNILAGSVTADMDDCPDNESRFIDISVPGAIPGNPVMLGLPNGIQGDGRSFVAWVQANDSVRVSLVNESGTPVDLANETYNVVVFKF